MYQTNGIFLDVSTIPQTEPPQQRSDLRIWMRCVTYILCSIHHVITLRTYLEFVRSKSSFLFLWLVMRDVTFAVTRDVTFTVTRDVMFAVTCDVTFTVTRDVTFAVTRDVTFAVTHFLIT